jgi:hypothetical protein
VQVKGNVFKNKRVLIEAVHKQKAEKVREKAIADQFEARRAKNKATRERKAARREERLSSVSGRVCLVHTAQKTGADLRKDTSDQGRQARNCMQGAPQLGEWRGDWGLVYTAQSAYSCRSAKNKATRERKAARREERVSSVSGGKIGVGIWLEKGSTQLILRIVADLQQHARIVSARRHAARSASAR